MGTRHDIAGAATRRALLGRDQRGLESTEVALISGLVIISLLVAVPLAAGGVQAAIAAVANTLATAGAGIN